MHRQSFPLLASVLALVAVASAVSGPASTTAPGPTTSRTRSQTVTTSFYSLATTAIPQDEYSIGMGQNGTRGNYYWLACIDAPFTTRGDYGGCGSDDLYTRCSGRTARGIDGDDILCDVGCVTHKIYENLDVTNFTPFIGCGRGTSTMNLVRTSTSSAAQDTTTAHTTAVQTGDTGNNGVTVARGAFYYLMLFLSIISLA